MTTPTTSTPAAFPAAIADGVKAAIETTFASICGAAPALVPDAGGPGGAAIIGIISFLGDVSWSFSLALPPETAGPLTEKFAGFEVPFDSPDMGDVVGELANVVAGDIVNQLDRRRIKAKMSLPAVARGQMVEVLQSHSQSKVRLPFRSAQGPFWCELACGKPGEALSRMPGT
jgi:CheY-specific phosphatase CheX